MNIQALTLKNFMSHKDTTLDLANEGIYNLVGENGSGKSSIREAISWCLFGKSRCKGAGEDLIHNEENEMQVIIEFEANGKNYSVARSLHRKESTKLELQEHS